MSLVSIHEAKTHLSRLIQRALDGEGIIIAKRDEALVRLQVVREALPARRFVGLKGLVLSMGDSFDEELTDFAGYGPEGLSKVAEDHPKDPAR
ncbi:MAG: type II toxin-antitoxin system prevent-host-death family antitoxin [Verrucomicrobiales bacterium VVV1]|nr:MAG: type II toxin-antitoxin system prevent-host-death family antitoxin [Verrucomicrobiales bacterium VVV1]